MRFKRMTNRFLDMLYPRHCPLCQKILAQPGRILCEACETRVSPVQGALCFKCGRPVQADQEYCVMCRKHPGSFAEGRGIFPYDKIWKASLMGYKYGGCREYGDFYGKCLWLYGRKEIQRWKPDTLVPVPLHKSKLRMRGFDQAAYLAERLSSFCGIPVRNGLVIKIRKTKAQKKLDAAERRRNLKGAFQLKDSPKGKRILIIDDVYTTGSTVDAVASCLRNGGAEEIFFLTLCIGLGNE